MSKRKFDDISKSKPSAAAQLSSSQRRQQQRFQGYLENGQTQLLGALKLARGFERQKLGRRHKDARAKDESPGDTKEVDRIEAEIAALKALDLNDAAEFYIARTLCRIKSIASSPLLSDDVKMRGQGRSPYQIPAESNVTARLFKSTAVKNTMTGIEQQVRALLKVQTPNGQQLRQKSPAKVEDAIGTTQDEWHGISDASRDVSDVSGGHDSVSELDESDPAIAMGSDDVSEDRSDADDIYGDYAKRLASGSDNDAESTSDHDTVPRTFDDQEIGESVSGSSTPSVSPAGEPKQAAKTMESRPKTTTKTTFLPTLASGYISGSESDSYGSNAGDTAEQPKRRNRMGQQARRALAEQHYGKAAKHLEGGEGQKNKGRASRDAGWDLKRGATNGRGKSRGSKGGYVSNTGMHATTNESRKPAPRTKDDTGPLHPSWIAKKKLKEQQNSGNVTFQGRKVVFD